MAQQHFGSRLAEARKKRGLSLEQVHTQLRITPTILESLERSDFYRMPLKGHARNMVSAYARFLGLDSTELTKQFLKEYHDFENHVARADNLPTVFSGYQSRSASSGGIEARTSSTPRSSGADSSQGFNSMWNKRIPRSTINDTYPAQTQGAAVVHATAAAGSGAAGARGAATRSVGAHVAGGVGGGMSTNGAGTTGNLSVPAGAGSAGNARQEPGGNNYGAGRAVSRSVGSPVASTYGAERTGSPGGSVRAGVGYGAARMGNEHRMSPAGAGLHSSAVNRSQGALGQRPLSATPARQTVTASGARAGGLGSTQFAGSRSSELVGGGRKRVQGRENIRSEHSRNGRNLEEGGQLDNQYGMGSYPAKPSLPMRLFGSLFNNPIALVIVLILILVLLFGKK